MKVQDAVREIELLIRSRYGVVFLDNPDEERSLLVLRHVANRLGAALFVWSPSSGLRRDGAENAVYGTAEPGAALAHIESSELPAVYLFGSLAPYMGDPVLVARLKETARLMGGRKGAIVVAGDEADVPEELAPYSAVYVMPEPAVEEYCELVSRVVADLGRRRPVRVEVTEDELRRLASNLRGLTMTEAEKVVTKVIVEDGVITARDIGRVLENKRKVVDKEGLLEYYPAEETMAEVADLRGLKQWLAKRKRIVLEPERARRFGLTFPRGILLLGVPGCGKSLCAKAVASEWRLPLLRLDPGRLYNKYVGESEKNFRRAVRTAERVSPVVLWIDEIEKALASAEGDADGGVSTRVFGQFLTWMQERRHDVFVVATANDVSRLPPELLRKGRFDEIFFVDLPDSETRKAIFSIHLSRRGWDPASFDLERAAAAAEGFSGAEIEQVVVSALYTAFSDGAPLTTDTILDEISRTVPLSASMRERIAALREWAQGRAVPAN